MQDFASGQIDVLVTYADARRDYEESWTSEFGRTKSIWEETNVIGVTDPIYNDTVCVSKTSPIMDDGLKSAIQTALINIGNTEKVRQLSLSTATTDMSRHSLLIMIKREKHKKLIQELSAAN